MPVNKKTNLGKIVVSDEAIAVLAGTTVNECYGVVGMTSRNPIKDGYSILLKKENYSKGVVITNNKKGLTIDLYIIVCYEVKISEVVLLIQERVKYTVEKQLNMDVEAINVHVEGIKINE